MEDAPVPTAGPGEVRVRVHAASVNPIDWKMAAGMLAGVLPVTFPRILGRDCAGELEDGERVAGVADPRIDGTHAQLAVLPAEQAAPIPAALGMEAAASLCVAGLSAYIPLVEVARVAPGQRVLVYAGAGGVGSLAIQIARQLGAEVTATASPKNHEYCRALGATKVLDYARQDLRQEPRFDVVLDTLGGEAHRRAVEALKPGGILVALSAAPIPGGPLRHDVRIARPQIQATRERLSQIFQWAAAGVLKPQVSRRYGLEDALHAYAQSQAGHVRGKLLLLPE
ncbi:MAG: NADP-dependent oxidoreductase [Betaproteobacteria bacterium]